MATDYENMLDYQQRVVDEKLALDSKIEKLEKYLASEPEIGRVAKQLLVHQCDTMKQYSDILDMRISIF